MNAVNQSLKVLQLYREFFTVTIKCTDRPLKLYIRRRAREEFRKNISAPQSEVQGLIKGAQEELQVIKRQVRIRQLYEG